MSHDETLTTTVNPGENHAVVRVEGRVIRENQAKLRAELEALVNNVTANLALDLQNVEYMDSSGLGCFSSIERLLQQRGTGRIAVFGASPNVERTWRMIRLDMVIPMFADEEEALAWLVYTT